MIEPAIVVLVLADQPTAGLIANRIYPLLLPDECTYPAVSYRLVSTVDEYTLDGPLELVQVRLQIDSWGNTYGMAKAVAQALKALLNGFAGTSAGVVIDNIQRDGESGGYDSTVRAYYVQTDWMIWFVEP